MNTYRAINLPSDIPRLPGDRVAIPLRLDFADRMRVLINNLKRTPDTFDLTPENYPEIDAPIHINTSATHWLDQAHISAGQVLIPRLNENDSEIVTTTIQRTHGLLAQLHESVLSGDRAVNEKTWKAIHTIVTEQGNRMTALPGISMDEIVSHFIWDDLLEKKYIERYFLNRVDNDSALRGYLTLRFKQYFLTYKRKHYAEHVDLESVTLAAPPAPPPNHQLSRLAHTLVHSLNNIQKCVFKHYILLWNEHEAPGGVLEATMRICHRKRSSLFADRKKILEKLAEYALVLEEEDISDFYLELRRIFELWELD